MAARIRKVGCCSEELVSQELSWSDWQPLDRVVVRRSVPKTPGVYQIRKVGTLTIAYMGSAIGRGGLQQRIGQRVTNPSRYLSVYEKELVKTGLRLEFRYGTASSSQMALSWESQLLSEYKSDNRGRLPPGNKVTPHKSL